METTAFENELKTISTMIRSWSSDALFCDGYTELLYNIKRDTDIKRRRGHAKRLKLLLMVQTQWLMSEWLRAKRNEHLQ